MAIVARLRSLPASRAASGLGPLRHALAVALTAAGCSLGLAITAAPAGAVVAHVSVGGGTTTVGLQPRSEAEPSSHPQASFANASGNAVLHGTNLYAIYWDPKNIFHHEWLVQIDSFLQRLGASSGDLGVNLAALGQYRDRSNAGAVYSAVFKASYSDTAKYPAGECTDPNLAFTNEPVTCLTDAQLRTQLQSFITEHALPKGMHSVFYVLLPPGVTVCVDPAATRCSDYKVSPAEAKEEERNSASWKESFCSYHAAISPTNEVSGDENTELYAVIPWSAGTAGAGESLASKQRVYQEAPDCQDGGFNPSEHEEKPEEPRELTTAEEEQFTKANAKEKAAILKGLALEGPHDEEPNQEGKGEIGDYAAGLADMIATQIAEEQANIVTDPLLNAWQDSSGKEVTDQCRNTFSGTAGPGGGEISGSIVANVHTEAGTLSNTKLSSAELKDAAYYLNNVGSLSGNTCVGGVGLVPRFTAPNPVNANDIVGFDGMESTVGLLEGDAFGASGPPVKTYATFTWNFGDGSPDVTGFAPGAPLCEAPWLSPCAASIFHSYTHGGSYAVTLTVTDVAGNKASVVHNVSVAGPPAAAPAAPPGSTSPGGSAGASGGAGSPNLIPLPTVSAAVASRSLRNALRKGLTVRYAVSERVAGHFEVLLAASIARRLGLHAPRAVGLAPGTPPQVLIGKAILVTTAGGTNTAHIQFSKNTASRVGRLHSVTLLLRLIVHNASAKSSTALTTVTLSH